MRNKLTALLFVLVLASGASCAQQGSPVKESEDFFYRCGPMVDRAMDAYNREDREQFYRDFSKDRLEKGDRAFRAIWVEGYKDEFGNILSKELDRPFCDINAIYPMLVYRAKFEKNEYVTIKVIFVKAGDAYKIFYIRFDALPPGTI